MNEKAHKINVLERKDIHNIPPNGWKLTINDWNNALKCVNLIESGFTSQSCPHSYTQGGTTPKWRSGLKINHNVISCKPQFKSDFQ